MSECVCASVCVCVPVFLSWWGLKPEYTQTHGDSCHGGWHDATIFAAIFAHLTFSPRVKLRFSFGLTLQMINCGNI